MEQKIINGDCLEEMKKLEAGSVDLILTDPPYGTIKGIGGEIEKYKLLSNSTWDETLDTKKMFEECVRVLRSNGKLILFSQEPYTSKLITESIPSLPFGYRMIWLKDHFANCLVVNKAPVSYFEDLIVFSKIHPKHDFEGFHPLRPYFKNVLDYIGLNLREINKKLGHRRAEHTFYVTPKKAIMGEVGQKADHVFRCVSTQFGLCTEKTYNELIDIFGIDKMEGHKKFSELKNTDIQYRENLISEMNLKYPSIFNLHNGDKLKSNVLSYKKDYGGLHPTQKPVNLLKDLIKTYSDEGDTILDFTAGSFSTLVACEQTNRNGIGIELDDKFCDIGRKRLQELNTTLDNYSP